jgi:hypothetical protein
MIDDVQDPLIPEFIPALVLLLVKAERDKGSELTREEVVAIRDRGNCMMVRRSDALEMAERRGYDDLDPANVWAEWQEARVEILGIVGQTTAVNGASDFEGADDLVRLLGTSITGRAARSVVGGHELSIEEIDGQLYGTAQSAGLSFVASADGAITSVQLHASGHESYVEYIGSIPGGLAFDDVRADVRRRLGIPSKSGEPADVSFLARMPAWDRFDDADVSVHVEYELDSRGIRMISVMSDPP